MTDAKNLVAVSQEDRLAACDLMEAIGRLPSNIYRNAFNAGDWDHTAEVQAFARHRLASAPSGEGEEIATLRDAVLAIVAATRAYLPPDGIDAKECINRILEATDNPAINPFIAATEAHSREEG